MIVSRYRVRGQRTVLQGELLPEKEAPVVDADDEGDEDFDDSDPQFMDAEEIAGGGMVVSSWTPRKTRVVIKANGVEHHVTGVFPLLDPWWYVTVEVKFVKPQYFTQGHPSYELIEDALNRRDDGRRSVLSLFLRACGVGSESVQSFLDWLPEETLVEFQDLPQIIAEFAKATKTMDFTCYVRNSAPGCLAMRALAIPRVLKYLPRLLPRQVKSLLMLERKDDARELDPHDQPPDKLLHMERILQSEPWKLGFGLLVSRELHLYHCEASWENFLTCDSLLNEIPELETNALIIYNKLKRTCYEMGDTYMELVHLTKDVSGDMEAGSAWEALDFLKDQGVVVFEGQRVFLHNFYKYESDIAEYIHQLTLNKPWVLDVDPEEVLTGDQGHQAVEPLGNSTIEINPEVSNNDPTSECMKTLHITDCSSSVEKPGSVLDEDQKKAVRLICSNPVTIISGKGGCGKTTVVSLVFKTLIRKENEEVATACQAFEGDMNGSDEWECKSMLAGHKVEGPISVLLTAPTGKAASLLKKKTELPAATLHQVTCSFSHWKKQEEANPGSDKKQWKFSKVEVLVVDEGSLVSVDIFSTALKLLSNHGKLAKLILLGDVRQLPSIQPGNLLADVFRVLDKLKWSVELRKNHRAESQLIVDNATRISQQRPVDFDAVIHLCNEADVMPSEDKKFILVSLPDDSDYALQKAVELLLARGPGLQDHKHSQFIAFRRKDCMLINELCCKHYSEHTIKNHKGKFQFQCNDKVCCTKNAYLKELVSKKASERSMENVSGTQSAAGNLSGTQSAAGNLSGTQSAAGNLSGTQSAGKQLGVVVENGCNLKEPKELNEDERLCNGEVFFITDDKEKDKIRELTLSDEDREFALNYKALMSRSRLRHAWARTIHTFQGSEEDTVVYVLGTAGRQNWKHVYTAITRGRKRVYIIAKVTQFDQALATKARERKTRLQQRLNKLLLQSRHLSNPTNSPPASQNSDSQHQYTLIKTPDQSPSRARSLYLPSTPTQENWNTRDCGDHPVQTDGNDGGSDISPLQKRTGVPADGHGTPSKVSRLESCNGASDSPLATTSLQNLHISNPCTRELKF